ncbi:hypothetical protein DIURU_001397 [Diutina rugosa]|uniref:Uncharacterized protein n=1 Tax=Diutina rugosa TaxID=5481 RepID=A0A642UUM1_DIURU|nr:uncharacterized protein DIURU_001397 [Diutina rugosa]KAA8905594.1 hypothetical protein DIURU_001397 [Diutina rugosa]
MPSPIFISKPSISFHPSVVLMGAAEALWATVGLVGVCLYTLSSLQGLVQAWHTLKMSVSIHLLFQMPLYLVRGGYHVLEMVTGRRCPVPPPMARLDTLVTDYYTPHVFLMVMSGFFVVDWDGMLVSGVTPQMKDALTSYPNEHRQYPKPWRQRLYYLLKTSPEFQQCVSRYAYHLVFASVVFALVEVIPDYKCAPVALSFLTWKWLSERLGAFPSVVVIGMLNLVDFRYQGPVVTSFAGASLLARDLLVPYFCRVPFTRYESTQWVKSREGVLWGFAVVFWCLLWRFPVACFWIYNAAQFGMGRLISRISAAPPPSKSAFYHWSTSQLVWRPVVT